MPRITPPHRRDANDTHDSRYFRRDETMPEELRGPQGNPGPKGDPAVIAFNDRLNDPSELPLTGNDGDMYLVNDPGSSEDYGEDTYGVGPYGTNLPAVYTWTATGWKNVGNLGNIQGIEGPTGDSAYDIAVSNGFVGTEQDWLDSLVGADGDPLQIDSTQGSSLLASPSDHDHDADYAAVGHTHQVSDLLGVADTSQIPSLDASKTTTGTFDAARIPNLDASKVASGTLNTARIPNLDAGKITSGTLTDARIPSLNASKVTAGTFASARIPSLDASKITSGTFSASRIPEMTLSQLFPNNRKCVGTSRQLRTAPGNVHNAIVTVSVGWQFHYFSGFTQTTDEEWAYVMLPGIGFGWFPTAQMGTI